MKHARPNPNAGKPGHVRTTSVESHACRECDGTIAAGSEAVSAVYPGWERRWWHAGCWNPAREAG